MLWLAIKNKLSQLKKQEHYNLVLIASYSSIAASASIIVAKFFGWLFTDSLTIMASLVDSLLDIASSFINLLAVRYAAQPPDHEHRFGHSKAEDLAVFSQASVFTISGILIIISAANRFFYPQEIDHSFIGILVISFSTLVTFSLILLQRMVITETKSQVVTADHLHYKTDFLANIAILFTIYFASRYQLNFLDPLCAIGIAFYMLYGAWELLQKSFKNLMDHEFNDDEKLKLKAIIKEHPCATGLHDLKTRYAGSKAFIQFHLEMDGNITLQEAHDISDEIERLIIEAYPNADVIIHQDPYGSEESVDYPH